MTLGLLVGIWVARYLGVEEFGVFSYAMAFVGLFATIATLGLDSIVIRELVGDESRRDILLGTSFWLKVFGAIVVLILLYIATYFTTNDSYTNSLIFIIALSTLFNSFNVIDFYFKSKVLSRYVVYVNSIVMFIFSIIRIALILNEAPLVDFAWAGVVNSMLLAIGYIYVYRYQNLSLKSWGFDTAVALELLRDSWPLILSSIVISIYMRIDQVMIKEMIDAQSVGLYAAAVRLSEAWYFVPMVISSSLFPAIQNAKEKSSDLYKIRVVNLLNILYLLSIVVILITFVFADEIITILYGIEYIGASSVLSIHIFASIFVSLGVGMHSWIIVENLQRYEFYSLSFGAFANICLNYLLIDIYGIIGAAVATLISQMVANIVVLMIIEKTRYIAIQQIKTILFLDILYIKKL